MIKKILVPTDCSDLSKDALAYAITFAKQFEADLTLLMVAKNAPISGFKSNKILPENLYLQLLEESNSYDKSSLKKFWDSFQENDIEAHLVILTGSPFNKIIKYAKQMDMDLIIMGTHGRTGIQHAVLGSVAEKVIRYSPTPVITIKQSEGSEEPK